MRIRGHYKLINGVFDENGTRSAYSSEEDGEANTALEQASVRAHIAHHLA